MTDQPTTNVTDIFRRAFEAHQLSRLDEAQELYQLVLANQASHFDALHFLGVIYVQRGQYEQGIESISKALRINVKHAAAFSNRGAAYMALQNYPLALSDFDQALAIQPLQPEAHYNRGKALFETGRTGEASLAIETCLVQNPQHPGAHLYRGLILESQESYTEALACYDHAIGLVPQWFEAHFNRANCLGSINRFAEAIASYDRALEIIPDHSEALNNRGNMKRFLNLYREALADFTRAASLRHDFVGAEINRAMCLLAMGDYAAGWEAYEARFKTPDLSPIVQGHARPRWTGTENVTGRTVLLIAEQGLGDTLQFVRFAPFVSARGARVILEVPQTLKALLATMPGYLTLIATGDPRPAYDYYCPLMSLPRALGVTLESIPTATYLRAEKKKAELWQQRLAGCTGLRVGLVWAGNPRPGIAAANAIDKRRSIPLMAFESLGEIKGATFISLQIGDSSKQILDVLVRGWKGPQLIEYADSLSDFSDTAALVSALDLVITCDTAVAHLAGGLNKKVWILNRFSGCWRWLTNRTDSPWYPSATLFNQPVPGDWASVIAAVKARLQKMVTQ